MKEMISLWLEKECSSCPLVNFSDSRYASFSLIHFTINSSTMDYNNRNI